MKNNKKENTEVVVVVEKKKFFTEERKKAFKKGLKLIGSGLLYGCAVCLATKATGAAYDCVKSHVVRDK